MWPRTVRRKGRGRRAIRYTAAVPGALTDRWRRDTRARSSTAGQRAADLETRDRLTVLFRSCAAKSAEHLSSSKRKKRTEAGHHRGCDTCLPPSVFPVLRHQGQGQLASQFKENAARHSRSHLRRPASGIRRASRDAPEGFLFSGLRRRRALCPTACAPPFGRKKCFGRVPDANTRGRPAGGPH